MEKEKKERRRNKRRKRAARVIRLTDTYGKSLAEKRKEKRGKRE